MPERCQDCFSALTSLVSDALSLRPGQPADGTMLNPRLCVSIAPLRPNPDLRESSAPESMKTFGFLDTFFFQGLLQGIPAKAGMTVFEAFK